jgi:septal ring factor EnvC (AmiA/AmiB activator)
MGQVPKPENKPKYNKNAPFEWVDSQWEKFMTEQRELKAEIYEKDKTIEQLRADLITCNSHFQKRKDDIENLTNELEQLKQDHYFEIRNKNLEVFTIKEQMKKVIEDVKGENNGQK